MCKCERERKVFYRFDIPKQNTEIDDDPESSAAFENSTRTHLTLHLRKRISSIQEQARIANIHALKFTHTLKHTL